jgi:hypothetical protein
LANEHKTIRQMLGHTGWADGEEDLYQLQTIKDNLRLFSPELLGRINDEVVAAGHQLVKKAMSALAVGAQHEIANCLLSRVALPHLCHPTPFPRPKTPLFLRGGTGGPRQVNCLAIRSAV